MLKRPAVEFTGRQAKAIGEGFAQYAKRSGLVIWACAILPDHVHLVLARHRLKVEKLVIQLKGNATERLVSEGLHPFDCLRGEKNRLPNCFGRGQWKVFLDTGADIHRAIRYVEDNPLKEGKKHQRWGFVTPYVQ